MSVPPIGSIVRIRTQDASDSGSSDSIYMWSVDLCKYIELKSGTIGLVLSQDPPINEINERRAWMRVLACGSVLLSEASDLEEIVSQI